MSQAVNPYGDGTASQRIVQTIEKVIRKILTKNKLYYAIESR